MDKTILPLSPTDMVEFFKNKEQEYMIDYQASLENLSSPKFLLMYIANLGLRCRIDKLPFELVLSYIQLKEFTNITNLQQAHANILYLAKFGEALFEVGEHDMSIDDCIAFATQNNKALINQMALLNSIPLFVLSRLGASEDEQFGPLKDQLVTSSTDKQFDDIGYSVIQLFTVSEFLISYLHANIPIEDQIYFTRYFDEYMFNGNNIFAYVFNPKNEYASLCQLISQADMGDVESSDKLTDMVSKMRTILEHDQNQI